MGRTVLLSDLHLGDGGPHEQFRADAALTAQLEIFAADPTAATSCCWATPSTCRGIYVLLPNQERLPGYVKC